MNSFSSDKNMVLYVPSIKLYYMLYQGSRSCAWNFRTEQIVSPTTTVYTNSAHKYSAHNNIWSVTQPITVKLCALQNVNIVEFANLLRMVRWVSWHCPPDTGFEIQTLEVWGRARYLSVTEAPHNTEFYEWMGKKHFYFLQTAETGKRTPNSGVKGSGANHYPRV